MIRRGTPCAATTTLRSNHYKSNKAELFCDQDRPACLSHSIEQIEPAYLHVALLSRFEDDGLE